MTFNGSVWHAFVVLLPLWILVFLAAFLSLRKGHHYFFDPKHNVDRRLRAEAGEFEPHSRRYQDLAKLIITLSAGAIAFLISILVPDKPAISPFAQRLQAVAPIVSGFFGCSIALLVFFILLQTILYEQYCHCADHSSYKRWKYATSMALGWTGLVSFVLGFVWLASNVF